jgi:hypothetical protein
MSAMRSPDPDPATSPGLEPGGGVPPGETPPAESGTNAVSNSEPPPGRGITRTALIAILVLLAVLVVCAVVGVVEVLG